MRSESIGVSLEVAAAMVDRGEDWDACRPLDAAWEVVFFWLWLWLFGSALASENLEPGQGQTVGFGLALAWPGSSHGFWQGFQRGFGFGLAKSQARPKPHRAKARKSQSRAIKPWLFGSRPRPEKHYSP
jgi:hypothetical protein